MMKTAFFHTRLRAPTIILNLAKKLAIFHHSSATTLVMIERYKSSIAELLPKIRDVFGQNVRMDINRKISRCNLTHILNESLINLHYVPTILAGTVRFVAIIFAEMREEILLNIFQLEVRFVQFAVAFIAKPQQTVR